MKLTLHFTGFIIALLLHATVSGQPVDSLTITSVKRFNKLTDDELKRTTISYNGQPRYFDKPRHFSFAKQVPGDLLSMMRAPFRPHNLAWTAAVAGSSVALILIDQPALDWVRRISASIHISDQTSYHQLITVRNTKVLQLPRNASTLFYQLGQGGTSLALAGGLWLYGKLGRDYRAIATASDISSTFITLAITTQLIKRISGRESPFVATVSGGRWKLLPTVSDYQRDTPSYDAFPSGHLATLMATVTILADNYPEKRWIWPVGYSLMGICMWTMANIEVHWLGDYPLAIGIGYLSGKLATLRHLKLTSCRPVHTY